MSRRLPARPEIVLFFGADLHWMARPGIASSPWWSGVHAEDSEAAYFYSFSALQSCCHAVDDGGHN